MLKKSFYLLIVWATLPALASQQPEGVLAFQGAFVRAPLNGETTSAYLHIINTGKEEDKLVGARCEYANAVELHTHQTTKEGVMQMRQVSSLPIPAGQTTELKPGGNHLMLINLTKKFQQGVKEIPITLYFEKAGERTVSFQVKKGVEEGLPGDQLPPCSCGS